MLIFGAIQIVLSQIPNLHQTWLLSTISALSSVCYALICIGLSIGKTSGELSEAEIRATVQRRLNFAAAVFGHCEDAIVAQRHSSHPVHNSHEHLESQSRACSSHLYWKGSVVQKPD